MPPYRYTVVRSSSLCGAESISYYECETEKEIYSHLVTLEDVDDFYEDNPREKELIWTPESQEDLLHNGPILKRIFEWTYTPAHGRQDGTPGKEWSGVKIFPYETPVFIRN